ncbi:hypothetical protein SAMN04489712_115166 [Thermomonospora echinospora]|uniref:Uncharacterized protein n=1 Tax=Thermomonospora echinospora TaxID=1992 RepID=A0A1H6DD46_9ACTN|nr:hypothetical protein [Thermomonospora echinospora]SEG83189.1 hypothetical protein SAMN04489712_115166 [Thermomonospora echinospora]
MGRAGAARDVRRLLEAGLRLVHLGAEGTGISEQAFLEVERLAVELSRRHGRLRFVGMLAVVVQRGVGELARLTGRSPEDIAAEHTGFCPDRGLREWMAEVMRAPAGAAWSPPPADAPIAPAMALVHLHVTVCLALCGAPDR